MIEIKKTVIVPHSPEMMFNLVADIANYPKYLPWCTASELKQQNNNDIVGAVYIEYLKIKTHFVTRNINIPFSKIEMHLLDGPFKNFSGTWDFITLGESGCKIEFNLKYCFTNHLLERVIGPVFGYISKNIVDCFVKEANIRYGKTICHKL